jgi:hypothetical protein
MPKQNQLLMSWGERVKQDLATLDVQSLGRVGVLLGGCSGEREISLMSGKGVLEALLSKGVDAHPFDPGLRCPTELVQEGFDRIFISLHGRYGEDGTIQGLLELLGLPYTGSGVLASALAIDKIATKLVWLSSGLSTPEFQELSADSDWSAVVKHLGLPLIVKPAHEGSSLGLTKVKSVEELPAAYQLAAAMAVQVYDRRIPARHGHGVTGDVFQYRAFACHKTDLHASHTLAALDPCNAAPCQDTHAQIAGALGQIARNLCAGIQNRRHDQTRLMQGNRGQIRIIIVGHNHRAIA